MNPTVYILYIFYYWTKNLVTLLYCSYPYNVVKYHILYFKIIVYYNFVHLFYHK